MTLITRPAEKTSITSTSIDTPPSYEDSVDPTVNGDTTDDDLLDDYDGKPPNMPSTGGLTLPVVVPRKCSCNTPVLILTSTRND